MATSTLAAANGATTPQSRSGPRRHVASLDGLRALAIFAVLGVHAGVPGFALGWLGVDLFFVLSGFLITTLLANEFDRNGRISLPSFWMRRFLRLMPAYWLYVGGLTAAIVWFRAGWVESHDGLSPGVYLASLWLYFVNYLPAGGIWEYQLLSLHLWSLAVEEQFYLVWPIVCTLALRLKRPERVAWMLSLLILARMVAFAGGEFLIHARGLGLTVGCAVALSFRRNDRAVCRRWLGARRPRVLVLLAIASIVVLGTCCQARGYDQDGIRRAILPVIVPCFAILCAMLWHGPDDRISRILAWRPLVYIGTISYGMYLYHMLCQHLAWHVLTAGLDGWPRSARYGVRLFLYGSLTLGVSAISYRFLEMPFLRLKERLVARGPAPGRSGSPGLSLPETFETAALAPAGVMVETAVRNHATPDRS